MERECSVIQMSSPKLGIPCKMKNSRNRNMLYNFKANEEKVLTKSVMVLSSHCVYFLEL